MNVQPTSATLEDVLQDPNTDWSQIREAIKVSSGKALTNVGCVVGALNHAAAASTGGGGDQIGQTIAAERNVKAANDDDDDDDDDVATSSFTIAAKEKTVIEEKNNKNNNSNSKNTNFEEESLQRINEENDIMGEQQRETMIMSNTKKQQQQQQQSRQQPQQQKHLQQQQGQGQPKRGSHSSRRNSSRRGSIERTSSRRGSIESIAEESIAAESILSSADASGISNDNTDLNSSIDIMDFGISHRQLSVVSSSERGNDTGGGGEGEGNNESGREESGMLSELCDSKGFLHWDPHHHQRQQQQQRNGSGSMNGSFRNSTTATAGAGVKGGVSGGSDGAAVVEKARRFKLSEGLSNRTILIDGRYNMDSERSLYSECSVEVGGDVNVDDDDNVEEEEEVNMTTRSSGVTTFSSTIDDVRQRRGGALDANNKQESIRTLDSSVAATSVGVPSTESSSDVQQGHFNKFDSTRALLQGTNNDADSVDVQSTQSSSAQSTANRTTSTSTSKRCEDRRAIYTRDESTRTFESNYSVDSKGFMPWGNKSRRRGGVNREESTRTYDSWAQSTAGGESSRTVDDSVDSMKGGEGGGGGGDFMHWDQTKKMSNLSLMFDSSNSINVDDEAEEEREKGNEVKMNASTCPAELGEILGQLKDERRRSSSSNTDDRAADDFTPAQLKYEPTKNHKLSVLQRMSSKLSSSLTSASTRTPRGSWNLATSLPSDQSDTRRTYQRQHRGSIAWSLTSLDRDGTAEGMISDQDIKLSILNARSTEFLQDPDKITSSKLRRNRNSSWTIFGGGASNNRGNGTDVATLSSLYTRCGEVPIRISREDNVNIEELRRDILSGAAAGDNRESDGGGEARRKSSFSLFAASLDDEL